MRAFALLSVIALIPTIASEPSPHPLYEPFSDPLALEPVAQPLRALARRQDTATCAGSATPCTALDSPQCCGSGTTCTRDGAGNIACCPSGAQCTGVLGGGSARTTSTTSGFVLGSTMTATTTSLQTLTPGATLTLAPGYSTLTDAQYPFLLIPSTYSDSQACLSAYSSCQIASTACFNSLAGGNGVTVSGLGGVGVTQTGGGAGLPSSSASSVCASLSGRGCYGIQSNVCNNFGGAQATATGTGNLVTGNDAKPQEVGKWMVIVSALALGWAFIW